MMMNILISKGEGDFVLQALTNTQLQLLLLRRSLEKSSGRDSLGHEEEEREESIPIEQHRHQQASHSFSIHGALWG